MFGFFKKDPIKKLEAQYKQLMEEAMHIQRSGDIKAYSGKVAEAEAIAEQIEALRAKQKGEEAEK
ncbi:MAG TPA: DUF6435 family protein [Saprospiraceae bacterium]|nr:DUF6435 family protein [Saprospiraceae bacterium]HMP25911.1 DUF6435 family protein [Saprospiraceae bacterium]